MRTFYIYENKMELEKEFGCDIHKEIERSSNNDNDKNLNETMYKQWVSIESIRNWCNKIS